MADVSDTIRDWSWERVHAQTPELRPEQLLIIINERMALLEEYLRITKPFLNDLADFIMHDGTTPLTGDWDAQASGYNITSGTFFPIFMSTGNLQNAAGVTEYIGLAVINSARAQATFRMPFDLRVKNVKYKSVSAPGAGNSFAYTLYKGAAATGNTATNSGASGTNFVESSVEVDFDENDAVSVELINVGTSTQRHMIAITCVKR